MDKVYNNVFDTSTIEVLKKLMTQGVMDGLQGIISLGKEANVFWAKRGTENLAVKIYRVKACNFNRMYDYLVQDPRFTKVRKTRRSIVFQWARREYRNLLIAYRSGVSVPKPIAHRDNIIVMEMIGKNEPGKLIKDLFPKNPKDFLEKIMENYWKLVTRGRIVHGDLSEFNIINFNEEPVFIDFSQGCSVESSLGLELLKRDIEKINNFFRRFNLSTGNFLDRILKKLQNSDLY